MPSAECGSPTERISPAYLASDAFVEKRADARNNDSSSVITDADPVLNRSAPTAAKPCDKMEVTES